YSVPQLARIVEVSPSTVVEDLKHISHSLMVKGYKLKSTPIVCYKCGARIPPRGLHFVSRCPKCGSTHIERPKYHLEKVY
ncbi:MAG: hypothetical protein J7L88_01705, partial [Thermoplasmata archaeon]|nr:hypothetical protein [Thermoplasmata archaeon]